ncbi:nuclear transport factor 2 family protein [Microbacterium sp.]|uniref:nuclear transport factor 2 family protein n=1 Tax=Microbacterium sp. TaxID=51671 RepID=UPI0037C92CE4
MSKTREWLDGYVRAWKSKDPADVRAIFTDDAEYWFRPDSADPVRGIDAIVRMWAEEEEPAEPAFELDVLVEDENVGVVTGWVDYPGHQLYRNMWEVHFGEDGRARRFVEWYMTPHDPQQ